MKENLEALGRLIREECELEGDFVLRSGKISHRYFDKYQAIGNAGLLLRVSRAMKEILPADKTIDLLAGLELGGAMLSTALSLETGVDTLAVRKKAKEYGTEKMIEGPDVMGMQVCIVEDVVTSGGAVFEAVKALRESGAAVEDVVCIILRKRSTKLLMSEMNLRLRALFEWETD